MKKTIFLFAILCIATIGYSQTGINTKTPHKSAALDVVSTDKGMLLPRMTTAQKEAIVSPASGLLVFDTDSKCISQNTGTETAPKWLCLTQKDTKTSFFYMPSISIDASVLVTNKTIDLYNEYKQQFGSPTVVSSGAPGSIPYFPNAKDLFYYITYYDNNVLKINTNGLNDSGVLTYDVIKESDYASFMNVVFVIK